VRQPSGKKPGGQPGHTGHALRLVDAPDTVVRHSPAVCAHCQESLAIAPVQRTERRQVVDLPPLRLVVEEHQAEEKRCPACHQITRGSFPADVRTLVQYGAGIKALAVYLTQDHLLPYDRTREVSSGPLRPGADRRGGVGGGAGGGDGPGGRGGADQGRPVRGGRTAQRLDGGAGGRPSGVAACGQHAAADPPHCLSRIHGCGSCPPVAESSEEPREDDCRIIHVRQSGS